MATPSRSGLQLSPPPLPRRTRLADFLAALGPGAAHADALCARYGVDLTQWAAICRPEELHESLYVLDLFDLHLSRSAPFGPGLDVGSKNWPYLPALAAAVPGPWTGVELAANRRYATLVTRAAVALRRCRAVGDATYLAGSVTDVESSFGVVTWFLPFVSIGPLRNWGLPDSAFDPCGLLGHVWNLVAPGGLLWITNQNDDEAAAQSRLFEAVGIEVELLGPMQSVLSPFRLTRTGWLARKRRRDGSG